MQPEKRDLAYIWDMLEAAREIVTFVKNVNYADFDRNHIEHYAVERQLLVIGEAANHLSQEFLEVHQEIAWRQLIGLRNVLAHEYGEIKVDRIFNAAPVSVPELVKTLERIIPSGE